MNEKRQYVFDGWVFDSCSGELSGPDGSVRLAPQPALVLTILLDHAGELVTREFLRERVWPDTIVEFDKSLNFCIRQVRAALGDSASSPIFIESLPRRGYRFMAPVKLAEPQAGEPGWWTLVFSRHKRRIVTALGGLVLLTAVVIGLHDGSNGQSVPNDRAREAAEMGGYLLMRRQEGDLERSIEFFREAIALSPEYGRAYAGLGSAYLQLSRIEEGKRALHRSLEIGPDQWLPHLTLALRALYVEYDRSTAAHHFLAALKRAPNEVVVQHTYAWYQAANGDLENALFHMGKALELDPVSPRVNGDVGRLFFLAGRYEEAIAHCRKAVALVLNEFNAMLCIVSALVEKAAMAEARTEAARLLKSQDVHSGIFAEVVNGGAGEGLDAFWRWAGEIEAIRASRGEGSHVHAAAAWTRAGEIEHAFEELDAALTVHCPALIQIDIDPAFRPLRPDPRFQDLLRKIGIPEPTVRRNQPNWSMNSTERELQ